MPADRQARAYFDTSALVKCYVEEAGTDAALGLAARHAVVSSALAMVELVGALRRQEASRMLTRGQREAALLRLQVDRTHWTLLEVDAQVVARAEALTRAQPIKTLDAVHLASVLILQAEIGLRPPFITGDTQQRRAAEALGLDVVFVA